MRPIWRLTVALALPQAFAGGVVRAQEVPAAAPSPSTAPLEERIAAARSVKVMTSILGVELGSELDAAHEKLDPLCAQGTKPKQEGGDDEDEKAAKPSDHESAKEKDADGSGERAHPAASAPKRGEEREEGVKVLWQLEGTDYSAVFVTADDKERINSITGFLRPEKQMPFDAIGEVAKAPVRNENSVIWDVLRPDRPLFRVIARGTDGKAGLIRIFVVPRRSGTVAHPRATEDSDAR